VAQRACLGILMRQRVHESKSFRCSQKERRPKADVTKETEKRRNGKRERGNARRTAYDGIRLALFQLVVAAPFVKIAYPRASPKSWLDYCNKV